MKVVQINVSPGGAPKYPVNEVRVTKLGLDGDHNKCRQRKGDPEHRRAVCLFPMEKLNELKEQGYPVYPGALGENITTEGIDYTKVYIGDRFQIGEIEVEISRVRTPCAGISKFGGDGLARSIYDPKARYSADSPKWGHSGFYAKVLKEGTIKKEDKIRLVPQQECHTSLP